MINLDSVIDDVFAKWTKQYKNSPVVGNALQYNWNQIGQVFNNKINHQDERLVVIPAQTGTGKTLFTKTYLAHLLAYTDEPALMVVREKVTAQETANDINEWAGRLVANHRGAAAASYSGDITFKGQKYEGKKIWDGVQNNQILIVTHAQLCLAAEEKWREVGTSSRLDKIYKSISGDRNLVIIDEEIELTSAYALSIEDLEFFEFHMSLLKNSRKYSSKYSKLFTDEYFVEQRQLLKQLKRIVGFLEKSKHDPDFLKKYREETKNKSYISNTWRFAKEIKDIYWDQIYWGKNQVSQRILTQERLSNTLAAADAFTRTWSYWEEDDYQAKMSDLMVSTGISSGAIILDATSTINSSYTLLKEESGLIDCDIAPVKSIKNYSNGSIFINLIGKSGKGMDETHSNHGIPTESDITNRNTKILNQLKKWVKDGEAKAMKLLVVTHKDYAEKLRSKIEIQRLDQQFSEIAVTHWGVIDGKNEFRDFNSIFVTSLPFLPDSSLTETIMTMLGFDGLRYSEERINELKQQLWITSAVSRLIQAINRIGFRKVIDSEGNVAPCKAFVVLPRLKGQEAKDLLLNALTGIEEQDWDFAYKTAQTRRPKSKKTIFESVLAYASQPSTKGTWTLGQFVKDAGHTYSGLPAAECRKQLGDRKSAFHKELVSLGYTIDIVAKTKKTYYSLSRKDQPQLPVINV